MSQNDTSANTISPLYGIAEAGAKGTVLPLVGTKSSASGGNSAALMYTINPTLQPRHHPAALGRGGARPDSSGWGGGSAGPRRARGRGPHQHRHLSLPGLRLDRHRVHRCAGRSERINPGVQLISGSGNASLDAALKNQVRCAYVKASNTANIFAAGPAGLDPTQDQLIVGGSSPIFTAADFQNNGDAQATAAVMKLVIDGYAGAGTIALGGFDYHDGTRATGEMRNFQAGQMIGAVLEYAQRKNTPVMIQIMSDGSLSSNSMVDTSAAGRDKLGWQGDNSSVAATVFLVYSPKGRPVLRNGVAGQQIGYFSSDGSVVTTSSPAANSVNQIPEVIMLNYMGLAGTDAQFATTFPMQGLGPASALAAMTVFEPIV